MTQAPSPARSVALAYAAFGDDRTAVLVYNPHTTLVEDAPSGECHTVRDGRIVNILLIFDRTPFDEARRQPR